MSPSRLLERVFLPIAVSTIVSAAPITIAQSAALSCRYCYSSLTKRYLQQFPVYRELSSGRLRRSSHGQRTILRLDPVLGPFWEISLDFELTDAAAGDRVRVTGIVRHVVSVPGHGDEGNGEPGTFSVIFELTDPVSLPKIQGFPALKKHNDHRDNYKSLGVALTDRVEAGRTKQIGLWFFSIEGRHEATPIPEPRAAALVGFGALCITSYAFCLRRGRRGT